jgi:GT2 family glycosyltransferase
LTFIVDVIIPIHNGGEFLQKCLSSVFQNRDPTKHRIILVDDGSSSSTNQTLRKISEAQHNVLMITHPVSRGFSGAVNSGLKAIDARIAVVLNSDTEVSRSWLDKIVQKFDQNEHIGIVGPLSNAAGTQSIPRNSYATVAESQSNQTPSNDKIPLGLSLEEINQALEKLMPRNLMWTTLVHGFCFAIRADLIRAIGLFDQEAFPRGFGEENDYCIRATNGGWGLVIALDTFVWHLKSQSFQSDERIVLKKHGMDSLLSKYGKQRMSNLIQMSEAQGKQIERLWKDCEAKLR